MPTPDTCVDFSYRPEPYNPSATYRINGVKYSDFPVHLPISDVPYIVEAVLENECGSQIVYDTFKVKPPPDIAIYALADFTAVCVGSDSIPLRASLPGVWSNDGGQIQVEGADTLFRPLVPGLYPLIIARGIGACRRSDTVHIRVEDTYPLQLNPPPVGCLSVSYVPEPFDSNVQYYINGNLQSSFPIALSVNGAPYTITAVAQNTCGQVSDTAVLHILAPVNVSIEAPGDSTVCSGSTPITLIGSDSIGQWVGPHLQQTPQGTVFVPESGGTFSIVFERGFDPCRRADSITLVVVPGDSVSLGPGRYACITQDTLLLSEPKPVGGTLSGPALSGLTVDLTQLALDIPHIYTYTVPNLPEGCNADEMTLVVTAPPVGGFTSSEDTTCVGHTVVLAPMAGGSAQFEVNWGDGTSGAALTHAYQVPGAYTVMLHAYTLDPLTGNRLCSVESTTSVYVLRPMSADNIRFRATPDSGCAPLSIAFDNLSAAENARYDWDFGNGQVHSGYQPPVVTYFQGVEDSTYYARLWVYNPCDTMEYVVPIFVEPQPRAALGITYEQLCSGGVLEASVLSTGNPENNTLFTSTGWTGPASRDKPTQFQFFADTLPDTVRIWLVSANACGSDTTYRDVVVHPTDVYALMGLPDTTRLCVGDSVPLLNLSTLGAPVCWSVSNGNTFVGDTAWIVFPQAGLYDVTLYAYGCGYDSVKQSLRAHPLPTLTVSHDPARCPGDTVSFSAATNAPGFWLTFGDGDTTVLKNAKKVYTASGQYPLQAWAVSERGCRAVWSGTVQVLTPPVATAIVEDSLCAGAPVLFRGTSTVPNSSCLWDFGDGNRADACQHLHTYGAAGVFTAALTVVSPEGCRDTDRMLVYVRERPEVQLSHAVKKPCSPAVVFFQSQTANTTDLLWQLDDGTTSALSAFRHTYQKGGTYLVRLIASNEGICFDTVEQRVVVFQTPDIHVQIDPHCTVAEGTDLTVLTQASHHIQVTGTGYQRIGDFHPSLSSGNYSIRVTSPEGCTRDTALFILPPNELHLWLEEDSFTIQLGERVPLQAYVNQTNVTFTWIPPTHLSRPDISNPIAAPWVSTTYTVLAENAEGCVKRETVWIGVLIVRNVGLFIPDAFTPNGDGVNDIFYVRNSNPAIVGIDRFQIFDKYDEKVFDVRDLPGGHEAAPENPSWGWDGTFRGSKAEMGSYRYVVELRYVDGMVRAIQGTVQLIR